MASSSKSRPILAFDLGGSQLRVGLVTAKGKVIGRTIEPTRAEEGPKRVIARIEGMGKALVVEHGTGKPIAVAAAVASPLDDRGTLHHPPNLAGWKTVPFKAMLARHFKLPVAMGNDATVAALGEHVFGDGRGVDDLVYLTVSTGIGGGVITGGQLLTGAWGMAGELGHIFLAPEGPLGKCGHRGCLESLACGEMIAARAKEAVAAGRKTSLAKLTPDAIKTKDVFEAAREGDIVTKEIVQAAATYLGRGIASLVHVFNPRKVILGGGVTKSWDLIQTTVEKTARGLLLPGFNKRLEIVRTRFGEDIGLLGATALAIRELQLK